LVDDEKVQSAEEPFENFAYHLVTLPLQNTEASQELSGQDDVSSNQNGMRCANVSSNIIKNNCF
jgi:hypothetical protein